MDAWLKSGTLKRKVQVSETRNSGSDDESSVRASSSRSDINATSSVVDSKLKKQYQHKYDASYLGLGFTWCGDKDEPKPQCVLCYEVLSNASMKPNKLRRHLETKHPDVKNKSKEFFSRALMRFKQEKSVVSKVGSVNARLWNHHIWLVYV